jgi:formate dehydrogenase subunit gamma
MAIGKLPLKRIAALAIALFPAFAFADHPLYGVASIEGVPKYDEGFAALFIWLQEEVFWKLFLAIAVFTPLAFAGHYALIGAKRFSHEGRKILVFGLVARVFHWLAAISFIILIPTGFAMIFGEALDGGAFVRFCKNMHAIATIIFAISVLPIAVFWIKDMFFHTDDIKWILIGGGYLSKEKKPVPAGKFNGGQKAWFWLAIFGGIIMIATGALMYFLNYNLSPFASLLGLTQIELLRLAAIVHNFLGMAIAALFIVHLYMSVFAIKGSLGSMIDGYKSEDELSVLHSSWYKKLKAGGKI